MCPEAQAAPLKWASSGGGEEGEQVEETVSSRETAEQGQNKSLALLANDREVLAYDFQMLCRDEKAFQMAELERMTVFWVLGFFPLF